MENNYEREIIKHNVLTSSEVAELLEITRQRVSAIVKSGEIDPIKQTSQGMLFLRSDIEAYKKKKELGYIPTNSFHPIYDWSGSTYKSIEFFKENIDKLDKIVSISIFFDEIDAAIKNFYTPSEFRTGELYHVQTPHFVIKDSNEQELWLGGCNCGYSGTGPRGSQSILSILRDTKRLGNFNYTDEEINTFLLSRVVNIYVDAEENVDVIESPSAIDESYNMRDFTARLYLFRNNLVLLQDARSVWSKNDKYPLGVIAKYRAFIPDPQEILVFPTRKQAIDAGYAGLTRGTLNDEVYCFIIRDAKGRELWLSPLIDSDIPLHKQNNVCEILRSCGFEIDMKGNSETISSKMRAWLDTTLRIIHPEPPRPVLIQKEK